MLCLHHWFNAQHLGILPFQTPPTHEAKTNQPPPALHYVLREKLQSVRVNPWYQYYKNTSIACQKQNCHLCLHKHLQCILMLGQRHPFFNLHQFLLAPGSRTFLASSSMSMAMLQLHLANMQIWVSPSSWSSLPKKQNCGHGVKSEANQQDKCTKTLNETIVHMSFLP